MHICIFQTGEPLHIDKGDYRPMRCIQLADKLIDKKFKVTIISSSFFHQRKTHRSKGFKKLSINKYLAIYLIPSFGYKKHVSIARLLDHLLLALNLHIFLNNEKSFNPDRIFLGFPPILTSFVIIRWARKNKIPLILDVKDKWPEIFIDACPLFARSIARIIFKPYFKITKFVFRKADKITSISSGFIYWIKNFSLDFDSKKYFISPLTRKSINLNNSEILESIEFWKKQNIAIKYDSYFCFVGTYSRSFNFDFILKIAIKLKYKFPKFKIILCGSGDQYESLCIKFRKISNVKIMGEINKKDAKVLISNSTATLAPYINNLNFRDHIPNKIIESLENGIPFITSIDGTLKRMIESKNNGIFIKDNKDINITEIEKLINDQEYYKKIKINALNSFKELFDFDKTYGNIIDNLTRI